MKRKTLVNKKANSQWLSPVMFLNWIIIIIALVIVSYWFFSQLGDIRTEESLALNQQVSKCLSNGFSAEEFSKVGFNLLDKCQFNSDLFNKQELYYLGLVLKDISGKEVKTLNIGTNWRTECVYQLENKKSEKNFPQCSSSNIYLNDVKTVKTYQLEIIAASNQK